MYVTHSSNIDHMYVTHSGNIANIYITHSCNIAQMYVTDSCNIAQMYVTNSCTIGRHPCRDEASKQCLGKAADGGWRERWIWRGEGTDQQDSMERRWI